MKLLSSAGDKRKPVAPPISIGCLACHGQFFAASLPIHQKMCFQRNAFVLVPCEKCKSCVRYVCSMSVKIIDTKPVVIVPQCE